MEITIDLSVGQKAFFICNSKVYEQEIVAAEVFLDLVGRKGDVVKLKQRVVYTVDDNPAGAQYRKRFPQDEIFATKEALLRSL